MRETPISEALEVLVALRDHSRMNAHDAQGAFIQYCVTHAAKSHAQFLQDMWVAYELQSRRNGFFVEFGAADGVRSSNSCYLERELGWNGILAEPGRGWYPALRNNRACFIDDRCVWTRTGETVTFNQPAIALHGTIEQYSKGDMHAETRLEGDRYAVETVSLTDLLAHWNAPRRIDYLSLDTEGSELDILSSFDFQAYEIRLITVEHNFTDKRQDLMALLLSKGYRRKFEHLSNVDDWYVLNY